MNVSRDATLLPTSRRSYSSRSPKSASGDATSVAYFQAFLFAGVGNVSTVRYAEIVSDRQTVSRYVEFAVLSIAEDDTIGGGRFRFIFEPHDLEDPTMATTPQRRIGTTTADRHHTRRNYTRKSARGTPPASASEVIKRRVYRTTRNEQL